MVKRLLGCFVISAALATLAAPGSAAELKIMEPADRALVKGTINFRIKPEHAPTDMFLSNPEISIQDEYGKELAAFRAARDVRTQICSVPFDTTKLPDGIYLVKITYRTLNKGKTAVETREDLTLGVRNGRRLPAKVEVVIEQPEVKAGEYGEITVRVYDRYGKLMPGARVEFKVDKGSVDTNAEISDSTGEAIASVDSDDPATVTVTVTVENLAPVTKTLKFVPEP